MEETYIVCSNKIIFKMEGSLLSTLKRLRANVRDTPITDKQELLLITDVAGSLYSHLLCQVKPGLDEPKKKDSRKPPKKKLHADDYNCPGPYWRTPDVIDKLKSIASQRKPTPGRKQKVIRYECKQTSVPRYNGPARTDGKTQTKICNTCFLHYKKDRENKLIE